MFCFSVAELKHLRIRLNKTYFFLVNTKKTDRNSVNATETQKYNIRNGWFG